MFLTNDEINTFVKKMQNMPKEAFNEMLELLEQGRDKQEDFLHKIIKNDPSFVKNFEREMQKQYKSATAEIEKQESENAIDLLDKLDNLDN